jgi:hypothetical protein
MISNNQPMMATGSQIEFAGKKMDQNTDMTDS